MMTTNNKLDNDTVRRLSKLISGSKSSTNSTPIMTGTVVQNDNSLYVAIDDDTLVPISDTNSNVSVGDTVTLALDDNKALIVGNITDTNATTSEVKQTNIKVAKAQATAEGAEKVATNYIDIDENKGITVGNMQESTLGHNTYIDANGVSIRDGETVLASFEDDEIALGKNSDNAVISMCNDTGKIQNRNGDFYLTGSGIVLQAESSTYATSLFLTHSRFLVRINDGGPLGVLKMTSNTITFNNKKVSLEGHTHTSSDLETVLYSSDTGTTSTVTLSESAENFTYLEIYYNYSSSNKATSPQFTTKVFSPNSKYVALQGMFRVNSQTMQFLQETVQISGEQILRTDSNGWWQNSNTSTSTVTTGSQKSLQFYIQRVVGIK